MLRKIAIFCLLFTVISQRLLSQTTDPSSHPLLDKYYPQPRKPEIDTSTKAVSNPIVTQQTGIKNSGNLINKPAPSITALLNPDDTTSAPTTSTTHSISGTPAATTTTSSSTIVAGKPAVILNNTPAQPPRSYDPNSLYDTRLGSSAPQYDTYEKNRNGEGSVTTSPK